MSASDLNIKICYCGRRLNQPHEIVAKQCDECVEKILDNTEVFDD